MIFLFLWHFRSDAYYSDVAFPVIHETSQESARGMTWISNISNEQELSLSSPKYVF